MPQILIIEDELIIARMYKMLFERKGWQVTAICTNGEAALKSLQEFLPDVIILDVTLKNNESGIALCQHLRTITSIPVIFTTGNDSPVIKDEIVAIPNAFVLTKPVNENALIELVLSKAGTN
jgi:CheY-like chemotaxis protein